MNEIIMNDLIYLVRNNKVNLVELSGDNPLLDDKSFILSVFNTTRNVESDISSISDRLKDDEDVVLAAVKHNTDNLSYASQRLKSNKTIALHGLEIDGQKGGGNTMGYCDPSISDNEAFAYSAIRLNPYCYRQLSDRLQSMQSVCEVVASRNPTELEYMPEEMKDTKSVVKIAVETDGTVLKHASDRLKDDPEIISIALKSIDTMDDSSLKKYGTGKEGIKAVLFCNASQRLRELVGDKPIDKTLEALKVADSISNENKLGSEKVNLKLIK